MNQDVKEKFDNLNDVIDMDGIEFWFVTDRTRNEIE